jgi:hypothetical protein
LVGGVEVDEAVDAVVVGRGRDVVAVLAVVEVGLLAEAEACVGREVLVLRVMRMLGRS